MPLAFWMIRSFGSQKVVMIFGALMDWGIAEGCTGYQKPKWVKTWCKPRKIPSQNLVDHKNKID